ncbi:MAG: NAD(P)H-dependent oxidoreductase [Planctomycetaceae bacterium]|jgi:putative NADPH-quinone reductase|nr:NAD(P)H-dependent oxidoreductase [Planctomycetaceae bacterium]
MKISLILAHPKTDSFNAAIAETARGVLVKNGHTVFVHDLYREHFDPVHPADEEKSDEKDLPPYIQDYIAEMRNVDGLIYVHPNWWGGPPAILRGWIDRVFRQNSVYNFTAEGPVCHIGKKIVQIFSTSNTPRDVERNFYGDPIEVFWKTVVFGLLGSESFERRNFEQIILSTPEERKAWLAEVAQTVERRFPS